MAGMLRTASNHLPSGFRRHSSCSNSSEFFDYQFPTSLPDFGQNATDSNRLSPVCYGHVGHSPRRSSAECISEKFSEERRCKGNKPAIGIGWLLTCEDQIDGPMDDGIKVQILDIYRHCWVAQNVSQHSIVEARYSNARGNVTVWTVGGTTDLIIVGFADISGNTLYPTVIGAGPLFLMTGRDPTTLGETEARNDPRVMRYFRRPRSDQRVLQSVVHEMFIMKRNGLIEASNTDVRKATAWEME